MRSLPLALALLLCLAFAAPAMGQGGASRDGYIQEGPQVVDRASGDGQDPGDGQDLGGSGRLPFTGMDLMLVAALGAGLLGVGAGMRQLTRPPAGPAA